MIAVLEKHIATTLGISQELVSVEVPAVLSHGHYATNVAMRLAKERGVSPRELADEFVATLSEAGDDWFADISVAGPGFINFTLSASLLHEKLGAMRDDADFHAPMLGNGEQVIVEYSDPNIAKPMHVGHLRATIIGDALYRILDFAGYDVLRWNYLGDWGTQFGKLIAAYKRWGDKDAVTKDPINELVALYVRFHDEMKEAPELEDEGRAEFKKLEDGDAENVSLWEWFREVSRAEFQRMYDRLGVDFDIWHGEAFYAKDMPMVTEKVRESIGKESEGALIVEFPDLPPALIEKQDGASLYMTRDIANIMYREKEYAPKKVLYVVGNEQSLHFNQLFAISEQLSLTGAALSHIKFGLVLGEDGKKLSTREGKAIRLEELMERITSLAYEAVTEKSPELSEEERREIAEAVGIAALKYNDLKENRVSDIVFNWEEMLNFGGNSAPYLQYTVARLTNIVNKGSLASSFDASQLTREDEQLLIKKLLDFSHAVSLSAESYITSHIATYLHELAKQANAYYEDTRILADEDEERKQARLALVAEVSKVLETGLSLLGITTLERI